MFCFLLCIPELHIHQELLNFRNVKSIHPSMQVCTKKNQVQLHSVFFKARNVSFIPFLSQWDPHKQSLTWMYHWFHIHPSKLKEAMGLCVNPQTCVQPDSVRLTPAPLSVNCRDYSLNRIFLLLSAEPQANPCADSPVIVYRWK